MTTASSTSAAAPGGAAPARAAPTRGRLVTDVPTRVFHALFALCFVGAWLSAEGERWRALHVTLGYSVAGLLAFRVVWGLVGPRHARLAPLWRRATGAAAWFGALGRGDGPPTGLRTLAQQGLNLVTAGSILLLLAGMVPLAATGWTAWQELGGEWLAELHEALGDGLPLVVAAHVTAIGAGSWLRRRNLARAMWSGRVEGGGPDLVKRPRTALGALLVVAVLAFWGWQWQDAPQGLLPSIGALGQAPERNGHDLDD